MRNLISSKLGVIGRMMLIGLFLSLGASGCESCGDSAATDSDGDGVPDDEDAFPDDPEEWADTDGDGTGDNSDAFPDDPNETTDSDGDGTGDNADAFPEDPEEWADSDGDGTGDNSDVFPEDPEEWADSDGDGTGDNSDCDNADDTVFAELTGYVDSDADTYTVGDGQVMCTAGSLPAGFAAQQSAEDDCDDDDPTVFAPLTGFIDLDADGYSVLPARDFCTDGSLPAGFVELAEVGDCDDNDPNNWTSCASCTDGDADTHYVDCDAFVTIDGPDCDDEDENNWTSCATCADLDADRHYSDCDAYVTLEGPDCDDTDILTNPKAYDLPDDGFDQNCDGVDLVGADGPGVYVDRAADCPGMGTLAQPYCGIQLALDMASDFDSIFVAGGGSPHYEAFQVVTPVGLFGGFSGGYQEPGGYVPGTWERNMSAWPARIEPDAELEVVVDISDDIDGFTMQGFLVFASTLTSGDIYTISTGEFPNAARVTLVDNNIQGGTTAYGNSVACKLDGIEHYLILVRNTITGGNSTADTTGLYLWSSAVVMDGHIDGGTSSGVVGGAGTTAVRGTMGGLVLLVNNYINGGDGTRHSMGVAGASYMVAINNIILGGDATEFSYGVSSPQQGSIQLFNNVISGGTGDLESKGVSSHAWNNYPDSYVVNNFIEPGTGAQAVDVQTRGSMHLLNNNLYRTSGTAVLAYYNGTDYTSTSDIDEVNECAWLYCEEGGGNLSVDPGFLDSFYHLDAGSPQIDSGIDPTAFVREEFPWYLGTDYEGDLRPLDGDGSGSSEWDIGRDEYAP